MNLDVVKWVMAADGLPRKKKKQKQKTKKTSGMDCSFFLASVIESHHMIVEMLKSGRRELACLCG